MLGLRGSSKSKFALGHLFHGSESACSKRSKSSKYKLSRRHFGNPKCPCYACVRRYSDQISDQSSNTILASSTSHATESLGPDFLSNTWRIPSVKPEKNLQLTINGSKCPLSPREKQSVHVPNNVIVSSLPSTKWIISLQKKASKTSTLPPLYRLQVANQARLSSRDRRLSITDHPFVLKVSSFKATTPTSESPASSEYSNARSVLTTIYKERSCRKGTMPLKSAIPSFRSESSGSKRSTLQSE